MRGQCSKAPWNRRTLTRPEQGAARCPQNLEVQDVGAFRRKVREDSALQPPCQDPFPGLRIPFPLKSSTPSLFGKSEWTGWWQASRPAVRAGSEAAPALPASAGQPGRSRRPAVLLWSLTFLVWCFLQEYAYCGTASKRSDRSTDMTSQREGGWETILSFTIFFKAGINSRAIFLWYFGL